MNSHPPRIIECAAQACRVTFTTSNNSQKYCDSECYGTSKRARGVERYHNNVERMRIEARLRKYELSMDEYECMKARAGGRCEICGAQEAVEGGLHIDHCHATDRVRGLLCNSCNTKLPIIEDRARLAAALAYLTKSKETP